VNETSPYFPTYRKFSAQSLIYYIAEEYCLNKFLRLHDTRNNNMDVGKAIGTAKEKGLIERPEWPRMNRDEDDTPPEFRPIPEQESGSIQHRQGESDTPEEGIVVDLPDFGDPTVITSPRSKGISIPFYPFGSDDFAVYRPWHFHAEKWGIYTSGNQISEFAALIYQNTNLANIIKKASGSLQNALVHLPYQLAFITLFRHEFFHYITETAAYIMELNDTNDISPNHYFKNYKFKVKYNKTPPIEDWHPLEEALADAYSFEIFDPKSTSNEHRFSKQHEYRLGSGTIKKADCATDGENFKNILEILKEHFPKYEIKDWYSDCERNLDILNRYHSPSGYKAYYQFLGHDAFSNGIRGLSQSISKAVRTKTGNEPTDGIFDIERRFINHLDVPIYIAGGRRKSPTLQVVLYRDLCPIRQAFKKFKF